MLGYFFGCDYSYRSGKLIRLCDVTLPPFFGGGGHASHAAKSPTRNTNHWHKPRLILIPILLRASISSEAEPDSAEHQWRKWVRQTEVLSDNLRKCCRGMPNKMVVAVVAVAAVAAAVT